MSSAKLVRSLLVLVSSFQMPDTSPQALFAIHLLVRCCLTYTSGASSEGEAQGQRPG
jgi:hypothetical protein